MNVTDVTVGDRDWVVARLRERRDGLLPHAPRFWNPVADQARVHGDFLFGQLETGQVQGWRTDDSVLLAAVSPRGVLVDDAAVAEDAWHTDGAALWEALATARPGANVRMVCPVYEPERGAFARSRGLDLAATWWLRELDGPGGGAEGDLETPGVEGALVDAPPVYAPGGPTLIVAGVDDPAARMPALVAEAERRGCASVVAIVRPGDEPLAEAAAAAGLRRHCEFYEGVLS